MDELSRVPLQSLRAAEAVARLGSLGAAAAALGVTVGAVSQQVLKLERVLGVTLFDRRPGGMVPTPAGREVAERLTAGFGQIAEGLARARRRDDGTLVVSVAPVFAARWLIWRLPRFQAAHPGIRIRLDADLALADPSRGDVDLCVRVGRGGYRGVRTEPLFPQVVFPVCAPSVAAGLSDHADLARVPIIRETRANFGWDDWLGPERRPEVRPGPGPEFSEAMLCLDAAISGAGVFLAFETLAVDALAMGRLAEPFRGRHATGNAYWLVTRQDAPPRPPARAFARWLRQEVAEAGLGAERAP